MPPARRTGRPTRRHCGQPHHRARRPAGSRRATAAGSHTNELATHPAANARRRRGHPCHRLAAHRETDAPPLRAAAPPESALTRPPPRAATPPGSPPTWQPPCHRRGHPCHRLAAHRQADAPPLRAAAPPESALTRPPPRAAAPPGSPPTWQLPCRHTTELAAHPAADTPPPQAAAPPGSPPPGSRRATAAGSRAARGGTGGRGGTPRARASEPPLAQPQRRRTVPRPRTNTGHRAAPPYDRHGAPTDPARQHKAAKYPPPGRQAYAIR